MTFVTLAGRTDIAALFEGSGIRENSDLNHTPVLLFEVTEDSVKVILVWKVVELLNYPDTMQAMVQWRGKYRSDFFQFTIGELRKHIEANPKQSYQVI